MAASRVSCELSKQAEHCSRNLAPRTGAIIEGISRFLTEGNTSSSNLSQRVTAWPRNLLEDAVGLRLCAGLHHLYLTSPTDSDLMKLFHLPAERDTTQKEVDAIVGELLARNEDRLEKWLDTPPQTNEVGRSANFVGAFSWLRKAFGVSRLECYEIGTSGGLNLLMPHYHFTYENGSSGGTVKWGSSQSTVKIKPLMKAKEGEDLAANIPDHTDFEIVSAQGCDLFPVNLCNAEEALRMKSFIWADHTWRLDLLDNAVQTLKANPPSIVKADAAKWVEDHLGRSSDRNTCRVLMHSIVWQYLPEETKEHITRVMHEAGKEATPENPIAWVALETNRKTFNHELTVRFWAGEGSSDNIHEPIVLGEAQAHGRWMRWLHKE